MATLNACCVVGAFKSKVWTEPFHPTLFRGSDESWHLKSLHAHISNHFSPSTFPDNCSIFPWLSRPFWNFLDFFRILPYFPWLGKVSHFQVFLPSGNPALTVPKREERTTEMKLQTKWWQDFHLFFDDNRREGGWQRLLVVSRIHEYRQKTATTFFSHMLRFSLHWKFKAMSIQLFTQFLLQSQVKLAGFRLYSTAESENRTKHPPTFRTKSWHSLRSSHKATRVLIGVNVTPLLREWQWWRKTELPPLLHSVAAMMAEITAPKMVLVLFLHIFCPQTKDAV